MKLFFIIFCAVVGGIVVANNISDVILLLTLTFNELLRIHPLVYAPLVVLPLMFYFENKKSVNKDSE